MMFLDGDIPPPTLEVLVLGEGAGGGARLMEPVLGIKLAEPVVGPGGGPGGGLRGELC